MIPRLVTDLLWKRLEAYPAVALVGPRQAGKTTLARSMSNLYFDLERESDRLKLDLQWVEAIDSNDLVILDEAQAWPDVFPRLRSAIDRNRRQRGRFLILGSVSPALMTQVSESLAGRLSIVELTPFVVEELPEVQIDSLWLTGGYPDGCVLKNEAFPQWQRDYLDLLIQRDLPNWGLAAKPQTTIRLTRMVAAVHGQRWNASEIGKSLGLSYMTVNSYMDYLAGAFLVRRLPAYHANLKKRLVKSPKYFWRDSGLLHAIHMVRDSDDLLDRPWVGASWEGFVIEQVLNTLKGIGYPVEPYYFLTSDRYEIDLVLDFGHETWAVEVKLSTSPSQSDFTRLDKTADMISAKRRFLISRITEPVESQLRVSCNLSWFLANLRRFLS